MYIAWMSRTHKFGPNNRVEQTVRWMVSWLVGGIKFRGGARPLLAIIPLAIIEI